MPHFRSPDVLERRNSAASIKKAMLEKFRAASQDPALEQQRLNRIAVNEARAGRMAERDAAKKRHISSDPNPPRRTNAPLQKPRRSGTSE